MKPMEQGYEDAATSVTGDGAVYHVDSTDRHFLRPFGIGKQRPDRFLHCVCTSDQ